ncbi:MAG: flavin reductase family protein [Streptococcaceae bacterium]|jgi:flavin reductase (DIM6/NTAB) family NADH-FMN oxidoreductase RutF|nr:flavin reductase family protein [Streptococcaceae bacterium]
MAKVEWNNHAFYLGYPVYIGMKKAQDGTIFATTMSSSFALGDILVLGMGANGKTTSALKVGDTFSLNLLGKGKEKLSDICGALPAKERLQHLKITEIDGVPTLDDALLLQSGKVIAMTPTRDSDGEAYFIVQVKIEKRLIEESAVDLENFQPLVLAGDGKGKRGYKSLDTNFTGLGESLRKD